MELGIESRLLNLRLKHVALPELIINLVLSIDILPRRGKSIVKIRQFSKPEML